MEKSNVTAPFPITKDDKIRNLTYKIILWDKNANFYNIITSIIEKDSISK